MTAINVKLTKNNMSRHDILHWINELVDGSHTKIEDLSSGVAYCKCMHLLFPNQMPIRKVKTNAKLERENMHNMRILQATLGRLHVDKLIPIDRLVKGRFQDNIEFVQWFKTFFDANAGDRCFTSDAKAKENKAVIRPRSVNITDMQRMHGDTASTTVVTTRPTTIVEPIHSNTSTVAPQTVEHRVNRTMEGAELTRQLHCDRCPSLQLQLDTERSLLKNRIEAKDREIAQLEDEKNFYFEKLRRVEKFCDGVKKHQISNAFSEGLIAITDILWQEMNTNK